MFDCQSALRHVDVCKPDRLYNPCRTASPAEKSIFRKTCPCSTKMGLCCSLCQRIETEEEMPLVDSTEYSVSEPQTENNSQVDNEINCSNELSISGMTKEERDFITLAMDRIILVTENIKVEGVNDFEFPEPLNTVKDPRY